MPQYDEWKRDAREEMVDVFGARRVRRLKIGVGILLAVIVIGLVFTCFPLNVAKDVGAKVVNADAIVYNYQWFYDQYQAIEAQKANLGIVDADSQEYRGMKMVLNRNIAEYNSRSSQITRNLWKANDLPYTIRLEE